MFGLSGLSWFRWRTNVRHGSLLALVTLFDLALDALHPPATVFRAHVVLLEQCELTMPFELELLLEKLVVLLIQFLRTLTGEKSLP